MASIGSDASTLGPEDISRHLSSLLWKSTEAFTSRDILHSWSTRWARREFLPTGICANFLLSGTRMLSLSSRVAGREHSLSSGTISCILIVAFSLERWVSRERLRVLHWSAESPMELLPARIESRLVLISAANDLKNDRRAGISITLGERDVDSQLEAERLEPSLETEDLRLASSAAGGSAICFICRWTW